MALEYIIKCDHACCSAEYDIHFNSLDETYGDVLKAAQEDLGWRLEMAANGLSVFRAYCKEHK